VEVNGSVGDVSILARLTVHMISQVGQAFCFASLPKLNTNSGEQTRLNSSEKKLGQKR